MAKAYFRHLLVASLIAIVVLPYVWTTNITAPRAIILENALLLWLMVPAFMVLADLVIARLDWKKRQKLSWIIPIYVLGLGLAAASMQVLFYSLTGFPLGVVKYTGRAPLFAAIMPVITLYIIFLFSSHWKRQKEVELKLSSERDRAAFVALAAQLKPHFFFNSLNTLEYLIDASPEDAKVCTRKLAQLYRKILLHSESTLVPLKEEIELAKSYLQIQKYRFGERLQVLWEVQEHLDQVLFPPNMLLNFIENAVKHGIEACLNPEPISIIIRSSNQKELILSIENTSNEKPSDTNKGLGFGLYDARKRLELLYNSEAELSLKAENTKVHLTLKIPKVKI